MTFSQDSMLKQILPNEFLNVKDILIALTFWVFVVYPDNELNVASGMSSAALLNVIHVAQLDDDAGEVALIIGGRVVLDTALFFGGKSNARRLRYILREDFDFLKQA